MKGWFEIFKVGKHTDSAGRTREWTEEDVKRIAESYNAQQYEAPIIFNY